jgi:hypothetical protein
MPQAAREGMMFDALRQMMRPSDMMFAVQMMFAPFGASE